jgi:hypothetical protein
VAEEVRREAGSQDLRSEEVLKRSEEKTGLQDFKQDFRIKV